MSDRANALREIEDMHERGYARECERGDLDKAAWHKECAEAIRALAASSEPLFGPTDAPRSGAATRKDAEAVAPIPDVPVVAWRGFRPDDGSVDSTTFVTVREWIAGEWRLAGKTVTPLVRQSDHLATVEKLTRQIEELRGWDKVWRDRVDAAEATVGRLTKALRTFAALGVGYDSDGEGAPYPDDKLVPLPLSFFRLARAVLSTEQMKGGAIENR